MSGDISTRRIRESLRILREGEVHIKDLLQKIVDTHKDSSTEWDKNYERILALVGFSLFEVSRYFILEDNKGSLHECSDFYFWPGYKSILGSKSTERVQILPSNYKTLYGGIGFESNPELSRESYIELLKEGDYSEKEYGIYDLSNASVWFNALLTPHEEDTFPDNSQFEPGGTHSWMAKGNINLSDNSALEILAVVISDKGDFTSREGIAKICLNENECQNWGERIAARLNTGRNLLDGWPAKHLPETQHTEIELEDLQEISEKLYSIWVAATFDPNWKIKGTQWVLDYAKHFDEEKGLSNLSNRIRNLLNAANGTEEEKPEASGLDQSNGDELIRGITECRKKNFRHWYTVALKHTVRFREIMNFSSELGSAMMFLSHEVDPLFFSIVKPWIESIYLELRSVEGAILIEEAGRERGKSQTGKAFGHEVKHVATAVSAGWLPEIDHLFEVELFDKMKGLPDNKIGRIQLEREFASDMGVAPVTDIIQIAGELITLWCFNDNPADVPFSMDKPEKFDSFLDHCWQTAIKALIVHALSSSAPYNRDRIRDIRSIRNNIKRIYGSKLKIVSACPFPKINWGAECKETAWLARVFIALFSNCIQHGDPARCVKVNLWRLESGKFECSIENHPRRKDDNLILQDLIDAGSLDDKLKMALNYLKSAMARSKSMERGSFGTRSVVNLGLEQLNGKITYWPESSPKIQEGIFTIRVKFDFPEQ
jgi:hypothetical protein